MQLRALSLLAVRLISVYLIAQGIVALSQFSTVLVSYGLGNLSPTDRSSGLAGLFFEMAGTFAPLVLGAVIWSFAPKLSRWIAAPEPAAPLSASAGTLVQGGIGVAGVVIAPSTIPGIIGGLYIVFYGAPNVTHDLYDGIYYLGYRVVLLALGVLLVAGSRRIKDWIFRLREMGT